MKKTAAAVLCALTLTLSSAPAFAWTNVSEGKADVMSGSMDLVTIKTTDYYNVDGVSYISFNTLAQAKGYASWNFTTEYNASSKTLYYKNTGFISSMHAFNATFTADNRVFYYYSSATGKGENITADYAPKIINGIFCVPVRTLKSMHLVHYINYDSETKVITLTIPTH